MKPLKRILQVVVVLLLVSFAILFYQFRFAENLQVIYASDGKVKFGYDKLQGRWLFNEYKQYPLGIDGPYILERNNDVFYVNKQDGILTITGTRFDWNNDFVCRMDAPVPDSFTFRVQQELSIPASTYQMPPEVLVISDIEGNFDAFKKLLIGNNVINEAYDWVYGSKHLVLVGDFMDRGDNVTQCLWLIYKLEQEALQAGGQVHFILGNHEQMNMQGNLKYTQGKYKEIYRQLNLDSKDLYAANTHLGRWLRTKNVMEKIGNILFTHGGISTDVSMLKLPINDINTIARLHLDDKTDSIGNKAAYTILGKKGILWFRGMVENYQGTDSLDAPTVQKILAQYNSSKIVVGHTLVNNISKGCDGYVIRIDVKHAAAQPQALIIRNNEFYCANARAEYQKL